MRPTHNPLSDELLRLASIELPETGVKFTCAKKEIAKVVANAERLAEKNVTLFAPDVETLVEGAVYKAIWLETQPMGGMMYAKRNPRAAWNNQLLFLLYQRLDGRFPALIFSASMKNAYDRQRNPLLLPGYALNDELLPDYLQLQGYSLPYAAFCSYFMAGCPAGYLEVLAQALEAYDAYLWRTRDPDGDGVLQSWCSWDTGEDHSIRFGAAPCRWPYDYPPRGASLPNSVFSPSFFCCPPRDASASVNLMPFRSMDLMAYTYEGRHVRALIAEELGDDAASAFWREKALDVRRSFERALWIPGRHAAFDRDKDNNILDILLHNNLRCMHYGLFSKTMADEFVQAHLLNPEEFWTPFPLPSIAANDPLFRNLEDNDWSGQPQGLTWQRAIRALENYGHFDVVTKLGRKLFDTLRVTGAFVQQYDPFEPEKVKPETLEKFNGYGPTVLATLEYASRLFGVNMERNIVSWSALSDAGAFECSQRHGSRLFTLRSDGDNATALVNGEERFRFSVGGRVRSDMDGKPLELVGIDTIPHRLSVSVSGLRREFNLQPNKILPLRGRETCPDHP